MNKCPYCGYSLLFLSRYTVEYSTIAVFRCPECEKVFQVGDG